MFYTNIFIDHKKNTVWLRGRESNGKQVIETTKKADCISIYAVTENNKNVKYKTEEGLPLKKLKINDIYHAQKLLSKCRPKKRNQDGDYTHSNLIEQPQKLYGNGKLEYSVIHNLFERKILSEDYDFTKIKITSIDIETSTEYGFPDPLDAQEQVLTITLQDFHTKQLTSFGCKDFQTKQDNVNYIKCDTEQDLLRKFINFFKNDYPDIITGWNSNCFDITYLSNRIINVLGESALLECCPFGYYFTHTRTYSGGLKVYPTEWYGIAGLDYMDLYKKFAFKTLESYSLNFVASEELGDTKKQHGYSSFKEHYTNDWASFVEYNIKDTELVTRLEEKLKLIELIVTMAYDARCNYKDLYSPVRVWDTVIYNYLVSKNIQPQISPMPVPDREIIGAFVKDPKPTKHDWVVSFDATSLYPTIMMTFNMSKDTLVQGVTEENTENDIVKLIDKKYDNTKIKSNNFARTANGQLFRKDIKGTLPTLISMYFDKRIKVKKEMIEAKKRGDNKKISSLNSQQMAAKILMNSLYGASGNIYFRWHDKRIAEGITMTGQYIIRYVAKKLNEYLNKICKTNNVEYSFYSDTDSTYITLGKFVEQNFPNKSKKEIVKLLDKFCDTSLIKVIDNALEDIFDYCNVYDKKLSFKREVIADSGVWIAKKRYALNVYDSEGVIYDEPELKVQGMEIVRSSTPAYIRKSLQHAVKLVLTKDERTLQNFVADLEDKWLTLDVPDISFPRTVNNLDNYKTRDLNFLKGTPIHVKGAILYNWLLVDKRLEKKYERIKSGDKIKFVYLKKQNPFNSNTITFPNGVNIPEEFNIKKYIDYKVMFDKAFMEPLNSLLDAVNWNAKEVATLEGLFG